jgi:hypothetical protein
MFERFTAPSRRLVVTAQEEARSRRHNYIGPEHMLLGMLHEPNTIACMVLESQGIDLREIRDRVDEIIGTGSYDVEGHIPFTQRAKKVLEFSLREALQLGHSHIGPEHLLLGLVREATGVSAQVLERFGVQLAPLRIRIIEVLSANPAYLEAVRAELNGRPEAAQPKSAPTAKPQPTPRPADEGSPLGRWARAHALSATRPASVDAVTDTDLRAVVAGLPLLARVGIAAPLALVLDLVLLTGGYVPADARLRALAGQPGVTRLRSLAWPPAARVALAALLACDLPIDGEFTAPDANLQELRDALTAALGGLDAGNRELREFDEQIARFRREKEVFIDSEDWEKAQLARDTERKLLAEKAAAEKRITMSGRAVTTAQSGSAMSLPVGEALGWQASGELFDALILAITQVSELTIAMLQILGSAAAAAEPTLPVKMRHRVSSLPRIGTRERRLIMETVTMSTRRSDVTGMAYDSASGTTGVSRRGRATGLVPTQLALPEELIAYRHASQELLYRVSEAETESPPQPVTVILDTTPATYGPPEVVLRLVAHVIAVTMWTVHKTPTLISLDRPGLARQIVAPSDLVTVWTARSLDPPDIKTALSTARRLGTPAILLTEYHAVHDHGVIPHRGLRVFTTHVADDLPLTTPRNPFHIHLPPSPAPAQLIRAIRELLEPEAGRRAS